MNLTHLATLQDKDGNIIGYFPGDSQEAMEGPAVTALTNHLVEHPVDSTVPNPPSPLLILWKPIPPDEATIRWPANRDNVAEGFKPPGA